LDIQLEKYKLIEWLMEIKDNSTDNVEWSEEVSQIETKLIKKGLNDIENGNFSSHEDVMNRLKSKFSI